MNNDYRAIKERFYALIGSISVEEIMSNQPLVEQIKTLSNLLVTLAG